MLMNRIETALMNNPARRGVQRFYEARGGSPGHGLHVGDRWRTRLGGDFLIGVAHAASGG